MSLRSALVRRWLGLPPARFRTEESTEWVAVADGTRLATTRVCGRGEGAGHTRVLIRTPEPAPAMLLAALPIARLLAEQGHDVFVQECRGRGDSEGRFAPFENEAADGADAIDWVVRQPGPAERLALLGIGYGAHAAWAALARARQPVDALVACFGSRDPHAQLMRGGALQLEYSLAYALGLGESASEPLASLDLARAARHRPLREADRVALRRCDAWREWVDHPERDATWQEMAVALPPRLPATLLVAGWHHPALAAQLEDHAALVSRSDATRLELVIGPWGVGPTSRDPRRSESDPIAGALRAASAFLAPGGGRAAAPVRIFVGDRERWRDASSWPPPNVTLETFHLHSTGRANSADGDGRLAAAPADGEPPDHYVYDPADPVPSAGGARIGAFGRVDQSTVESRGDVLCYTSDPLERDLEILGSARATLFVGSDAPDTDFTAKLVEVDASGTPRNLCDGIVRCRRREQAASWLSPDRIERVPVELCAAAHRVRAGHRLRLEVSSSSFPRFDAHGNTRDEPARLAPGAGRSARQTLHHDGDHPSKLELPVAPF